MNSQTYAIQDHEGKFFRGSALNKYGKGRFVENLNEAMFYKKRGTAAGIITSMANQKDEDEDDLNLTIVCVKLVLESSE